MYAQMSSKPLMAFYAQVDGWTYGNAKHIALLIGGLLLYVVAMVMFYCTRASFKYIYMLFAFLYKAVYGSGATDASVNGGAIPTTVQSAFDSVSAAANEAASSTLNTGSGDEFEF